MSFYKKICASFLAFVLMLFISGCVPEKNLKNFPLDFVGSTWRTEGGEMEFTVDEAHQAVGTITTEDGVIEVVFSMSPIGDMLIYPVARINNTMSEEEKNNIDFLGWWYADYDTKDSFSVFVDKTTFFEHGDKFTFHRVDDGTLCEGGK